MATFLEGSFTRSLSDFLTGEVPSNIAIATATIEGALIVVTVRISVWPG